MKSNATRKLQELGFEVGNDEEAMLKCTKSDCWRHVQLFMKTGEATAIRRFETAEEARTARLKYYNAIKYRKTLGNDVNVTVHLSGNSVVLVNKDVYGGKNA